MSTNRTNPTTFRYPFTAELADQPDGVQAAHRYAFSGLLDVNQAIAALKQQMDALKAGTATAAAASSSATITNVTTAAIVLNTVSAVAAYSASPWDVVLADTSIAAFTVTLPVAASATNKAIIVKKVSADANVVTVAAQGTDTIDGHASIDIAVQGVSFTLVSNGVLWEIV